MAKQLEWWESYFRDHWIMSDGTKSHKVTVMSIDFIEKTWNVSKGTKILDLGCGYGRLSIELARRGYDVVGLDYSESLLNTAKIRAEETGVSVDFVRCDMRKMEYEEEFDGVISWDASFGYFSDVENDKMMKRIARSMRSGGELILDLHNRDSYLRKHLGKKWKRNNDYLTVEDWTFDVSSSRLNIYSFTVNIKDGRTWENTMSFREYTHPELRNLLRNSGLDYMDVFGDLGYTPDVSKADTITILAKKQERAVG